jgi:hypothetical protein
MKKSKKPRRATLALVVLTAVAALALASTSARAWGPTNTTYLTFSGPVSLPGVTLAKGTYTFERPDGIAHVVRVTSRAGSHVYFTGFTVPVTRPDGVPRHRAITFRGEVQPGSAPEIDAWYPDGNSTGEQFIYYDKR